MTYFAFHTEQRTLSIVVNGILSWEWAQNFCQICKG